MKNTTLALLVLLSLFNSKIFSQPLTEKNKVYRLVEMTDSFARGGNASSVIVYRHILSYDSSGQPVKHIWNYSLNQRLQSSEKFQYSYDEKNGRLVAKTGQTNRYNYFYNNNGSLVRITLEILVKNNWVLYEETFMEEKEVSKNKKIVLFRMDKKHYNTARKDTVENYCNIEYTIGADNNILQSKVNVYNYKALETPKVYTFSYDDKPNALQQIFIERFYEFDFENRGLTNLKEKKSESSRLISREYTYNDAGYPIACTVDNHRYITFKYETIEMPQQKPLEKEKVSKAKLSVALFPNPATTFVTLKADGFGEGAALVKIYDTNGKLYRQVNYTINNILEALLPLGGIPKGFYIIEMTSKKGSLSKKLLIQ